MKRSTIVALVAGVMLACGTNTGPAGTGDPDPPGSAPPPAPPERPSAIFLVDRPDALNGSEQMIVERLEAVHDLVVRVFDDDVFEAGHAEGCDLVVMSKSVDDEKIGAKLKPARCGIVFWDDNQQQLRMLATIDNDGSQGTTWHTRGNAICVVPSAPAALRGGLSGIVDFYDGEAEVTFGRASDVPSTATVVGELQVPGDHRAIYAYDTGDALADGSPAAGRRVFFGLFTDTFFRLSDDGLVLFDAAVRWALGDPIEEESTMNRAQVLTAAALTLASACDTNTGPSEFPDEGRFAFVVVGDPDDLNDSEVRLRDRLEALGFDLEFQNDEHYDPPPDELCRIVVVSKTVTSDNIDDKLKGAACPVLFWEDNMQRLQMMATIDNDGSGGTSWHSPDDEVFVRDDAPAELRADLSGPIRFYDGEDEMTFAPENDAISSAIVVAEQGDGAGGNKVIYVVPRGAELADGTTAAGDRLYFGLYNDTFRRLTDDGLRLFDALVQWGARP